jgi:Holliday junction DNA helicase RuvA
MIGQLRGRLVHKKPNLLLLDVQGVGYEVFIPLTTFYDLPAEGGEVVLKIHTHVREDALTLFGFLTQREKDLFQKLVSVSGIGPRLAISVLSGAKVEELAHAIAEGDVPRLTAIPGIGRKTAERLILELKPQVAAFLLPEEAARAREAHKFGGLEEDVLSALVNLGYPKNSAEKALSGVRAAEPGDRTFEGMLRQTLRRLSGQ